jgi:hypothetical protein
MRQSWDQEQGILPQYRHLGSLEEQYSGHVMRWVQTSFCPVGLKMWEESQVRDRPHRTGKFPQNPETEKTQ